MYFPNAHLYNSSDRYADNWLSNFSQQYLPLLHDGMTILDVGAGRTPTVPIALRPDNCHYVGLDISSGELQLAPSGSYDEILVADILDYQPHLSGTADLVLSWQVLEHVHSMEDALTNIHAYLKPGGSLITLLTGRNAHFAVANRLIPFSVSTRAMSRLLGRPPDTVFVAHYDMGTHTELTKLLSGWQFARVLPLYRGADYWSFATPLKYLYMKYESWALNSSKSDLATHYLILAVR